MKRFIFIGVVVSILLVSCLAVLAHSGRTDANGGHWDTSTGTYHYHTGESAGESTGSSYLSWKIANNELSNKYKEGYDKGYEVGYAEGNDDGFQGGYDKGYDEGYNKGYNDGYEKGYEVGYDEGCEKRNGASTVVLIILAFTFGLPLLFWIFWAVVEFFKFIYNKLFKQQ